MGDWHCIVNGRQDGPLSLEQIRQWVRDGRVGPADPVWTEGMANWTPAGQVPELSAGGSAATPAARPPAAPPPPPPAGALAGKRPGGLTALAALNFIFGAANVIWRGIMLAAVRESRGSDAPFLDCMLRGSSAPSAELVYLVYTLGLVAALMEILAGVGYLGRQKVLGYFVGNAFAILAIIYAILSVIVFWSVFHSYAVVFAAGELIYAGITLGVLNTGYRRQFA